MSARQVLLNVLGSTCEVCGSAEKLQLHHKDKNKENNQLSNIQLLCASCHGKAHGRPKRLNSEPKSTIQVNDELKQILDQIGGQMASKNGERRTYEDIIEELIRAWLKK